MEIAYLNSLYNKFLIIKQMLYNNQKAIRKLIIKAYIHSWFKDKQTQQSKALDDLSQKQKVKQRLCVICSVRKENNGSRFF